MNVGHTIHLCTPKYRCWRPIQRTLPAVHLVHLVLDVGRHQYIMVVLLSVVRVRHSSSRMLLAFRVQQYYTTGTTMCLVPGTVQRKL